MDEMESTVAVDEAIATEAPADDAQAAEISAEELMGNLTGGAPEARTSEHYHTRPCVELVKIACALLGECSAPEL